MKDDPILGRFVEGQRGVLFVYADLLQDVLCRSRNGLFIEVLRQASIAAVVAPGRRRGR